MIGNFKFDTLRGPGRGKYQESITGCDTGTVFHSDLAVFTRIWPVERPWASSGRYFPDLDGMHGSG